MSITGSKPSHRRQQIWVYVIAGLFLCDFVLCGYLPSQQRLTSLRQARAEQQRTISMAAAQSTELARLETKLRDTQKLVERFDACIPRERALGGYLKQVTDLMVQYDLTDQVVLPGTEQPAGELGCIPVHMTCKGTLTQLFNFFRGIRTLDRLVRIERVTIDNDPSFTGQVSLQAETVIFYQSTHLKADGAAHVQSSEEENHGA